MLNDSGYVTLEDVTSDRQAHAEAHRRLNARRPIEWLLGSSMFAVVFGITTWFLQPSVTLGQYVIIIVVCFVTGGVTVLFSVKKQREWRKAKEDELETIENKIRSGEKVPKPNTLYQGTRRDKAAPHSRSRALGLANSVIGAAAELLPLVHKRHSTLLTIVDGGNNA